MENHSLEAITLIALNLSYEDMVSGLGHILFFFNSKEEEGSVLRMLHDPELIFENKTNKFYRPIAIFLIIFLGILIPVYIIIR